MGPVAAMVGDLELRGLNVWIYLSPCAAAGKFHKEECNLEISHST